MIEVRDLQVSYGGIRAVRSVDLTLAEGEFVAVVGRNGAGKSSLLRAIAGITDATGGAVHLDGRDVTALAADVRVRLGINLVPEGRGVFAPLTVEENLIAAGYRRRLDRTSMQGEIERVVERFPVLRERLRQQAGSLSGGEQQMLAVARGLMCTPRFLLVDEPSMGLAPLIVDELYELFDELRDGGLGVLVVEQYVPLALARSSRAYVLEKGEVEISGASKELAATAAVSDVYMSAT